MPRCAWKLSEVWLLAQARLRPSALQQLDFGLKAHTYVTNVLFICGKNKWRSPTAEQVFADHPGIECASAGLSHDAQTPLSGELVDWAQLIFVMEAKHKVKLSAQFKPHLGGKRVVCLNIPDNYKFMEPALVKLLQSKVTPHLA